MFAIAREAHQQMVDLFLREGVIAGFLADVDALGVVADQGQDVFADEGVIDHRVGGADEARGAQREQFGVPRAGANKAYVPLALAAGVGAVGARSLVPAGYRAADYAAGFEPVDDALHER